MTKVTIAAGLACAVLATACSSEPSTVVVVVVAPDAGQPDAVSETDATPAVDTAAADDTAPPPVDSFVAVDASETGEDTAMPDTAPVDTGPPPVTWTTKFPDHDVGDQGDWRTDFQCAHLDLSENVRGARTLPSATTWRSFRATVNVEADGLTCPEMVVRVAVKWGCVFTCANEKVVQFKVAKAVGITTYAVTGDLTPAIIDPLTPGPKVQVLVSQHGSETGTACGRLDVWPGTVTFSSATL